MKLNINQKMAAFALALMGMGVATSCTDTWDEHYQEEVHGEGTLWQAITKEANLSNFAKLIEAVDMKKDLGGSQVFTVFAPTNDVFSTAYCDELIASYKEQVANGVKRENNTVIKEFVQNHVALYNYSASSLTNDSIVMMNGKYQVMKSKSLGGAAFGSTNYLAQNGVLFTVDNLVPYSPNIYEYLVKDPEISSFSDFIHYYDVNRFMASMSVPGEIIDGQTHYLDSVTQLQNVMFSMLGRINSEDSTYWMLAPTNAVWEEELEKNKPLFVYDKTVDIKDSLEYLFPRMKIVESSLFSMNINHDEKERETLLYSTNAYLLALGKKFAARRPNGGWRYIIRGMNLDKILFNGTDAVTCSNGMIYKDSRPWIFSDLLIGNSTIEMEAEKVGTLDSVYATITRPVSYVTVGADNPFYDKVSEHSYIEIDPYTALNQKALFDVYNVLSNVEYEIYAVTVPTMAADTLAAPKGFKFRATIYYNDANGKQQNFKATSDLEAPADEVAYIRLGTSTYKFPTCSYGLDKPQVKILLERRTRSSDLSKGYSNTMRIDKFVFVPVIKNEN